MVVVASFSATLRLRSVRVVLFFAIVVVSSVFSSIGSCSNLVDLVDLVAFVAIVVSPTFIFVSISIGSCSALVDLVVLIAPRFEVFEVCSCGGCVVVLRLRC